MWETFQIRLPPKQFVSIEFVPVDFLAYQIFRSARRTKGVVPLKLARREAG